jgi:hypothetical protein
MSENTQGWRARLAKFAREWPLHIAGAACFAGVLIIAPQQSGLIIYKASLLLGSAIVAYWLNRTLFHRDTDEGVGDINDQWQLVTMVCAAMIAAGLAA